MYQIPLGSKRKFLLSWRYPKIDDRWKKRLFDIELNRWRSNSWPNNARDVHACSFPPYSKFVYRSRKGWTCSMARPRPSKPLPRHYFLTRGAGRVALWNCEIFINSSPFFEREVDEQTIELASVGATRRDSWHARYVPREYVTPALKLLNGPINDDFGPNVCIFSKRWNIRDRNRGATRENQAVERKREKLAGEKVRAVTESMAKQRDHSTTKRPRVH